MKVLVDRVFPSRETVWLAEGTDPETGDRIAFAGDWRPLAHLAHDLGYAGCPLDADVDQWQVIRRWASPEYMTDEAVRSRLGFD